MLTMSIDARAPEALPLGLLVAGRYRLKAVLGRGGMGTVYRAHDVRDDAAVALKVLRPRHTSESAAAERFRREATLAGMEHKHVAAAKRAGELPDGRPFLAMELLTGETLGARLERTGRLSTEDAVRIGAELLDGLAAAHERGIVHRDVKPANVFLAKTEAGETTKLLDFGVARPGGKKQLALTKTGDVIGTPAYLSPEQATGLKDVDARVDIWAVGVLLYRMLAGRMPFGGRNFTELVLRIVSEDPEPLRKVAPEVSAELGAVVGRALAKQRDQRFSSAAEMRAALLEVVGSG